MQPAALMLPTHCPCYCHCGCPLQMRLQRRSGLPPHRARTQFSFPLRAVGCIAAGKAPLGFGLAGFSYATTLTMGTPRYPTYYLTTEFALPPVGPGQRYVGTLSLRVDDGVLLYVNSQEVGRINVAAGAEAHTLYATTAISVTTESLRVRTVSVPAGLVAGANTLTVVLKQAAATSFDLLFDARLTWTTVAGEGASAPV